MKNGWNEVAQNAVSDETLILCAHIQSSPYRNEQCVRPVWCDLEVVRSALVRALTGLYFLLFVTERVP